MMTQINRFTNPAGSGGALSYPAGFSHSNLKSVEWSAGQVSYSRQKQEGLSLILKASPIALFHMTHERNLKKKKQKTVLHLLTLLDVINKSKMQSLGKDCPIKLADKLFCVLFSC